MGKGVLIAIEKEAGLFLRERMLPDLLKTGGYEVVGSCTDPKELFKLAAEKAPDLIIVSQSLPDARTDIFALTKQLAAQSPAAAVVLLNRNGATGSDYLSLRKQFTQAGAMDLILLPAKRETILEHIEEAMKAKAQAGQRD